MPISLLMFAGAILIAAPAEAEPQAVAKNKTEAPKLNKYGQICRRVVPTGSIMSVKQCYTPRAENERSDNDQDSLRQFRDSGRAAVPGQL
jgi:hypothetical protein